MLSETAWKMGEYVKGFLVRYSLFPLQLPMETPLEEGECDKIGGKALDNGGRNEQVVKAKWRRSPLIPTRERRRRERTGEKLRDCGEKGRS